MPEIIELLKGASQDPWILTYILLWAVGWFLKEKTRLNNEAIPVVLLGLGLGLGLLLIELSVFGAIAGGLLALAQMGFYDLLKPMLPKNYEIVHSDGIGEDQDVSTD